MTNKTSIEKITGIPEELFKQHMIKATNKAIDLDFGIRSIGTICAVVNGQG